MVQGERVCAFSRSLGLASPCLALAAVAMGTAVILIAALYPPLVKLQASEKVTVQKGHATFEQLRDPTPALYKSVYFFNLTNADAFEAGAKPVVEQIGPYSYREHRLKNFINFTDDQTQLVYNQTKTFFFEAESSGQNLSETDRICTINFPLVAAVAEVEALTSAVLRDIGRLVLKKIFKDVGAHLYMCQAATPLIWNFTNSLVHALHTNLQLRLAKMEYPRDWVSIQQNASRNDSLPSIIYTGVGDISRIGQFVQWDGHNGTLDTWPFGGYANDINGTEGLFFRPNLVENEPLEVFVDDVQRSFPLQWTGTVSHLGLRAFRYKLFPSVFESAFTNPENAQWGSWCPDGLFYLGPTQYPTVPVFGSAPNFLGGDPILLEKVDGLHPDPALHETTIDVEPVTGANIQFKWQLQINLQVNQTSEFSQLSKVNGTLYFPVMYINEHSELDANFTNFQNYLERKGLSEVYLLMWLVWVIFALLLVGSLLCILSSMCACGVFARNIKSQPFGAFPDKTRPLLTNQD